VVFCPPSIQAGGGTGLILIWQRKSGRGSGEESARALFFGGGYSSSQVRVTY